MSKTTEKDSNFKSYLEFVRQEIKTNNDLSDEQKSYLICREVNIYALREYVEDLSRKILFDENNKIFVIENKHFKGSGVTSAAAIALASHNLDVISEFAEHTDYKGMNMQGYRQGYNAVHLVTNPGEHIREFRLNEANFDLTKLYEILKLLKDNNVDFDYESPGFYQNPPLSVGEGSGKSDYEIAKEIRAELILFGAKIQLGSGYYPQVKHILEGVLERLKSISIEEYARVNDYFKIEIDTCVNTEYYKKEIEELLNFIEIEKERLVANIKLEDESSVSKDASYKDLAEIEGDKYSNKNSAESSGDDQVSKSFFEQEQGVRMENKGFSDSKDSDSSSVAEGEYVGELDIYTGSTSDEEVLDEDEVNNIGDTPAAEEASAWCTML